MRDKPRSDLWIVELSPSQGEWYRVFVKGARDKTEAFEAAQNKIGVYPFVRDAYNIHDEVTVREL